MHAFKVVASQRMLFDRDEDQPLAARRVVTPRLPGGDEVVAQAKAQFQHREARAALPALRQAIALQEDMPGLFESADARVVKVVVQRRSRWFARRAESHLGRLDRPAVLHLAKPFSCCNSASRTSVSPR